MLNFSIKDIFREKIIITGDVGVGKTRLLAKMVDDVVKKQNKAKDIVVLDFAPNIPLDYKIASSISNYCTMLKSTKYIHPLGLTAPRLMSKSPKELIQSAKKNARIIKPLIEKTILNPPEALFIDDLTIYLQSGNPEIILELIRKVQTFASTAYKGNRLDNDKGTGITLNEKKNLDWVINNYPEDKIHEIYINRNK